MVIKHLSLTFGLETIFDDITLTIPDQEKIAITGVNGAGKTTFFKIILKELEPDHGSIYFPKKMRISYLPQTIDDSLSNEDMSVFDYLLKGRPIQKLEQEIANLYEKTVELKDNKEIDKLLSKISNLQTELDFYEPYQAESELLKLIDGMQIDSHLLDQKIKSLSGGQKSKVAFARLLYSKPDLLLLDEPTNHLDHTTKGFVTEYLKNYHGTIYLISHDIPFLNEITTKTIYLDKCTHKMELFHGNYEKMEKLVKEREERLEKLSIKQQKEKQKLEEIIARYIRGNEKKANIAKDRQKKLARLEEVMVTTTQKQKKASIQLHQGRESTKYPLKLENVCFKYDKNAKKYLLYNINLQIPRQEKFLIVGENGVGKSTLLKLIVGLLSPDQGTITIGPKTDIAYYAQEQENLNIDDTVLESIQEFSLTSRQEKAVLGKFLFYEDDLYKKVKVLSPGERARLSLAKITLQNANLLILDEPTNHLDKDTQEIIANNLKTFPGTILLVSHNTAFVKNLGIKRMLILPSGTIKDYNEELVSWYEEKNKKEK